MVFLTILNIFIKSEAAGPCSMLCNYVYQLVYTHGELRQKVAASETERLKDGDDICPLNEEGSKSQIK